MVLDELPDGGIDVSGVARVADAQPLSTLLSPAGSQRTGYAFRTGAAVRVALREHDEPQAS